jgi:putative MATE family efflux protein
MQDLTKGSITKHMFQFAAFMAVSMFVQTLYFLADLYWVGRLGKEAIAAVGLAGTLTFVTLALTQTLGVGTTTLVSHAAGRKDKERVNFVFNQSMVMSCVVGFLFAAIAFSVRKWYVDSIASDPYTARLAVEYLNWFLPAMGLQFCMVAIGSALRGSGIIKPTVFFQVITIVVNIVLAPFLIFGWVSHHPLGVAGAAISTLVAVIVGIVLLALYVTKSDSGFGFSTHLWRPHFKAWWEMAKIGLPAGGEFILMSVYMTLVYWIIRNFGASAQAGFGIGSRLMQSMFMPVVAIAFAAAPIAGQNFGARIASRVRESFYSAAGIACAIMLLLTAVCQIFPSALIHAFSKDPSVIAFGTEYFRIISWNFLAAGLSFTTSSIFQGIGNTLPPLASSATRFFLFAVPAYILSLQPGFEVRYVWYISVASVIVQATLNLILLQREFRQKLDFAEQVSAAGVTNEVAAAMTSAE